MIFVFSLWGSYFTWAHIIGSRNMIYLLGVNGIGRAKQSRAQRSILVRRNSIPKIVVYFSTKSFIRDRDLNMRSPYHFSPPIFWLSYSFNQTTAQHTHSKTITCTLIEFGGRVITTVLRDSWMGRKEKQPLCKGWRSWRSTKCIIYLTK